MPHLAQILKQRIQSEGDISFARFMEIALYWPKLGYYETAHRGPGRAGDFFTSVSVGPLFGRLLGCQFAEWLAQISMGPVQLMEIGAHQGDLTRDVLEGLSEDAPDLMARLQCSIVEPSPARRAWQQSTLRQHGVHWLSDLDSIPPGSLNGILFANEVLDAFPVHRLGWDVARRDWFEWRVGWTEGTLVWRRRASVERWLQEEMARAGLEVPPSLAPHLPQDFTVEVSPQARTWWQQAARCLGRGVLLTLDYGAEAEALLAPARQAGTARAYRKHRQETELLRDPGTQDLTAHVNFTQIRRAGLEEGLQDWVWESQEGFLVEVWERAWARERPWLRNSGSWKAAFHTLTHPGGMGRSFRVLAQAKGMTKPIPGSRVPLHDSA